MRWPLYLLIFLLTIASAEAQCGPVADDLVLGNDLECDLGLTTAKDGATIDCRGYTIYGQHAGTGINIIHNDIKITNCNLVNLFTGISAKDVRNLVIENTFILNTSTAIQTERVDYLTLKNIKTRNAQYHDLYALATTHIEKSKLDIGHQTYIEDTRLPGEQVEADLDELTFRTAPELIRSIPKPDLLRKLNLTWLDHVRATSYLDFNTTVLQTESKAHYTITAAARHKLENLTVYVYFPETFTNNLFVRAQGALMNMQDRMITYPGISLEENETAELKFSVTTLVPKQQLKLPVTIPVYPRPPRPSKRTAQKILFGLFALSALIFVYTKKYLLKKSVGIIEQLGLLAGVLAIWSMSYKFTITALQLTKDFIAFMCIVALTAYYFHYVIKHHKEIEKLNH